MSFFDLSLKGEDGERHQAPTESAKKAVPPVSFQEGGIVQISRRKAYSGTLVKLNVLIDGVRVGRIGSGETVTFPLEIGKHNIQLTQSLSWSKSAIIQIEAKPHERVEMECGYNSFAPYMLGGMVGGILYRKMKKAQDIYLRQIS